MDSKLDLGLLISLLNFKKHPTNSLSLEHIEEIEVDRTVGQQLFGKTKLKSLALESPSKMNDLCSTISKISFCKSTDDDFSQYMSKRVIIDHNDGEAMSCKRAISIASMCNSPDKEGMKTCFLGNSKTTAQDYYSSSCSSQQFDSQFEEETPLPTLKSTEKDAVRYIDSQTLCDRLNYEAENNIKKGRVALFDCRYDYEYEGGRINYAQQLNNPLLIENMFFSHDQSKMKDCPIVLYCEFSYRRSIQMYNYIRNMDRKYNEYPNLTFPDMYILEKGYSNYYQFHPDTCEGIYIQMDDPDFGKHLKESKSLVNQQWNQLRMKRHTIK